MASLFTKYLNEANGFVYEGVVGNPESDLIAITNELAYLSGSIEAESSIFESLTNISESVEFVNEAISEKIAGIKKKFIAFIDKAIEFFADLSAKLQAKVFSVVAKMNKNGVLKKDVEIQSVVGKEFVSFTAWYFKLNTELGNLLRNKDAEEVRQKVADAYIEIENKRKLIENGNLTKREAIPKGAKVSDAIKIIERNKDAAKSLNSSIKLAKKVKAMTTVNTSISSHPNNLVYSALTKLYNLVIDAYRRIGRELYKNTAKLGAATVVGEKNKEQ